MSATATKDTLGFQAGTQLKRVARLVRSTADEIAASGTTDDARVLAALIGEAEDLLHASTATMRQAHRPLSVSGFGETHDRMIDEGDKLTLTAERICAEFGVDDSRTGERGLALVRGGEDG